MQLRCAETRSHWNRKKKATPGFAAIHRLNFLVLFFTPSGKMLGGR